MDGGEKRRPKNGGTSGKEEPTNADDRESYSSPKPKKIKKLNEDGPYYPHEDCIKIKIEMEKKIADKEDENDSHRYVENFACL
jgi:hypothetical protein